MDGTLAPRDPEPVRIDGPAPLVGTLWHPPGAPRAAVTINGATGVPARFYAAFARWLAETRGVAVLTWDYRGFGASGDPRRSAATMTDWGRDDPQAVRAWMRARFPGLSLRVIGHSLGGNTLPFQSGLDEIDRVVAVAAGPAHVLDHPWPYRALALAFWFGHVPALVAALGHVPGRLSGFGADLPRGVYWQWRRWCLARSFADADPALGRPDGGALTAPVTLIGVADDPVIPPANVRRLAEAFPNAPVTFRLLTPADHGLPAIGHLAAFAKASRAVWPVIAEALDPVSPVAASPARSAPAAGNAP
jgi:predicted alpha/beta hydrolase